MLIGTQAAQRCSIAIMSPWQVSKSKCSSVKSRNARAVLLAFAALPKVLETGVPALHAHVVLLTSLASSNRNRSCRSWPATPSAYGLGKRRPGDGHLG